MENQPVIVVGDGWAALGAVGFLVSTGVRVTWVVGSGARCLPPTGSLTHEKAAELWSSLAEHYGVQLSAPNTGLYLREYRNKAFREPSWVKAPSAEAKAQVIEEYLWKPEQRFASVSEVRFSQCLFEIEEQIRSQLLSGRYPNLNRVEGVPLQGLRVEQGQVLGVVLGSGEEILGRQVIYADRWSLLPALENLPKPISFMRKREPMGVLQVSFSHRPALQGGLLETFFAPMHKEAGEKIERHFWGYVTSEGKKSVWTLCLSSDEVEDNHEIAKKFRRLKSSLDKVFAGSDLIPSGCETFNSTLSEEQVRFEEDAIFSEGKPQGQPFELAQLEKIVFLSDGYGPSDAMEQVGALLGVEPTQAHSQREDMNVVDA